jgi:DNA polymerase-3 subunit epsilon/CBS domain-containing protein
MLEHPLIMPADATLAEAAAAMNEASSDCVFVGNDDDSIVGIVSERDIVRQVRIPVDSPTRVRDMKLTNIMSSPVITVSADDFMHVALGRMSRFDIRHIGVLDDAGTLVGWVSSRELVRQRVTAALIIGDRLATAEGSDDLAAGLRMLPTLAASLTREGVPGLDIAAVISGQYGAALREAVRLAEVMMRDAGRGRPPVEYAMLMLGSAARGESLLAADQAHAILFADSEDDDANRAWFMELGSHIADILDAAGIPYCSGDVMSRNAAWCRSLAGWRQAISDWVRRATPCDLMNVDIFFDFRVVHGNARLAGQL